MKEGFNRISVGGFAHLVSLAIYLKLDGHDYISKCSSSCDATFGEKINLIRVPQFG